MSNLFYFIASVYCLIHLYLLYTRVFKTHRRVVQICCAAYQGFGAMALCDDGTIWYNERPYDLSGKIGCGWIQVRDIPNKEQLNDTAEE